MPAHILLKKKTFAGGAFMISIDPLKTIERLWDKIVKARLPKWLKAILLILVTLAILVNSFWTYLLIKQITDLVSALLGYRLP
jgi:hypothetical protein